MLTAALLLGCLYWLTSAILVALVIRAVPILNRHQSPDPPRWPKLSIIIPACNEADTLEAAMAQRMRDDYPNLEVLLVEDRSTDATPEIADRLATTDPRLRVIHVTELPPGWLGKVHAMQRGREAATGDWLLFSDADVHVVPGTMRRAIAYAEQRGVDHLAVLPELWSSTFLLDTMLASFIRILCVSCRLWAVEKPGSRASVGVGAFNLVRRAALDRAGGFERLRLTVVDDMGLGQLLKSSGARSAVTNGRGLLGLHFYRSAWEMARGAEKAVYVAFRFNFLRLLMITLIFCWLEISPFVGWAFAEATWLRRATIAAAIIAIAQAVAINRWVRRPLLPAVLIPVGALLNAAATVRAGLLALWRGGIVWRGTLYRHNELRRADQFRFP